MATLTNFVYFYAKNGFGIKCCSAGNIARREKILFENTRRKVFFVWVIIPDKLIVAVVKCAI